MAIDDILKQQQQDREMAQQRAAEAPALAQRMRNETHQQLTAELVAAVRAINDPGLGEPKVTRLSDIPGSNIRVIEIDCAGSVRTVLKATVQCQPGDNNAYPRGPLIIRIFQGTRRAESEVDWDRIGHANPPSRSIDPERLREAIYSTLRKLQ